MIRTAQLLAAAALAGFVLTPAAAAERPGAPVAVAKHAGTAPARPGTRRAIPEYRNVAGFRGRVDDPLHAYASETMPPPRMGPVIMNFPMPNAVWW
jgi:hypothetical protein